MPESDCRVEGDGTTWQKLTLIANKSMGVEKECVAFLPYSFKRKLPHETPGSGSSKLCHRATMTTYF